MCILLLACCTRSRAISPGLTRGGSRELQLQLHARWGYSGLGRVRCTSRPSVCPRPASSLPSVTSLLPPRLPLSTFFVHPSFLLLLLRVLSPHPRRRLLPLSKSPAETRYMQAAASFAHGHTWQRCVRMRAARIYARARVRVRVHARVRAPSRLLSPFEKKEIRHDLWAVRLSARPCVSRRETMDSLSGNVELA